jgi:hypothetical protein
MTGHALAGSLSGDDKHFIIFGGVDILPENAPGLTPKLSTLV